MYGCQSLPVNGEAINCVDNLSGSVSALDRFVIENGERPDTVAELLYGDSRLDYIVILVAGIININHQWPLEDHQVYNNALDKYGSVEKLNGIHHYETFELRDEQDRQILPPN